MADKSQLEILSRGVEPWNEWRKQNPAITPDLFAADLRGRNLSKADFREANLTGADLRGADLAGANFRSAELVAANLYGANSRTADFFRADLSKTDLNWVDFTQADLTLAKLNGAELYKTTFIRADLTEADLSGSEMFATSFGAVDLSLVKGLETVRHVGPSTIGTDTIFLSKGKIPDIFLRGAGIPDNFITQIRSLAGAVGGIDYYSCFISHSTKDVEFARHLHADLRANSVPCWFAPENLGIGDKFRSKIDEAILRHDRLLLVLSEDSIKSAWVEKEAETAFEHERRHGRVVLFPIRLDDAVMETNEAWAADIRRTRYIGDFREWKNQDNYRNAFAKLLRDLRSEEKRG